MSENFFAHLPLWSALTSATTGSGQASVSVAELGRAGANDLQLTPEYSPVPPPAASAVGGGTAGILGNNADFASADTASTTYVSGDIHAVLPPPRTAVAWYLRSEGRELLTRAGFLKVRMRSCGARIRPRCDGVTVYARPDRAYGRVGGVCVCGQSLCCPVCAPRVAAFRSEEVSEGFRRAVAAGYEAGLVTFTMPHAAGSELGREADCFSAAWSRFSGGRRAVRSRRRSLGHHVGRECTWSMRNGWHYHHHQLRFDEPGSFEPECMRADWLAALDWVGRRTRGADAYAFDFGAVGTEAGARYVAKLATSVEAQARAVGSEIASAATKGRNLATLLKDAVNGDDAAEWAWVSGVRDICARKISSVRWSRGLRDRLGMVCEKSDAQVAAEEVLPTDELLGSLTAMQWRGVLLYKAEFALCCAANRGRDAVNDFLAGLELGALDAEPRAAIEVSLSEETCYRGWSPRSERKDTCVGL